MNSMKFVYLFIGFFVVWCVLSAIWYVFGVKDLTTDPTNFNSHDNTRAIVEILLMLLVSFLIGYLAAHYQREGPLTSFRKAFRLADTENKQLQRDRRVLFEERSRLINEKTDLELQFKSKLAKQSQNYQILSSELDKHKLTERELKEELNELRPRAERLGAEVSHLRFKVKQLEFDNKNKMELRVPKEDEISDLTLIHGIGPAISRKLYAMGIYSFKQISQFDDRMISQVGKALKYFPDRIQRDDWVGQARRLTS